MLVITTLNVQYSILSVRIVIAGLSYRTWIDEDCTLLITEGCIIRGKEMLNIMRNVRVTAYHIIVFCKTLVIHLVNPKLTPIWVIQITMNE